MTESAGISKPVIAIENLTKRFGAFTALDQLTLTVQSGEVHGLLGPNGAGKSTTIRILLGLLRKNGGSATIYSKDTWEYATALHGNLAYVPGDVTLWDNLSGGEIIDLLTALRGRTNAKRREELIERFKLDPSKMFRTYSKGNRQKVALVSALASDVDLYILDEPTSGLDPLLELVFQDEIRKLKSNGKTVLLSSHILAEVEALCDRVTIIREGRVVESGSLDSLRHLAHTTIKATTKHSPKAIEKHPGVKDFVVDGNHIEFQVTHNHLNDVFKELTKLEIVTVTSHPPTLEELFMSHYEDKQGQ